MINDIADVKNVVLRQVFNEVASRQFSFFLDVARRKALNVLADEPFVDFHVEAQEIRVETTVAIELEQRLHMTEDAHAGRAACNRQLSDHRFDGFDVVECLIKIDIEPSGR